MPTEPILDFDIVERYVLRVHPDPDGTRQNQAAIHGGIVAAPWLSTLLNADRRRVLRWRASGIPYWDADKVATALGVHPSKLWPDWWTIEPDTVEQLDFDDASFWRVLRAEALDEARQLRQEVATTAA
jgi:hypothetical protein